MRNSRTKNARKLFDHSICSQNVNKKRQKIFTAQKVYFSLYVTSKCPKIAKIGENLFSATGLPKILIFELLFQIQKLYAIFSYLTNFHIAMAIFKENKVFFVFFNFVLEVPENPLFFPTLRRRAHK